MHIVRHDEIESIKLRQKYPIGTIVKINQKGKRCSYNNKLAVLNCTYAQKYWGDNYYDYSVVILNEEGYPESSVAWFNEEDLELVSNDTEYGLKLIEYYDKLNNC